MDSTNNNKSNFLTKSAWVYIIVGCIAFIVGLFVKESGIWISGATAVSCGVYCYIKGKQQLKEAAAGNQPTANN